MTLSVYVHHAYEREKREALDLWADRLRGIVSGADVVPMQRAKATHGSDDGRGNP